MRDWISHLVAASVLAVGVAACKGSAPAPKARPRPSDSRVKALADAYLAGYFDRFPETVTQYGVPGRAHDRLTDNSAAALKDWESKEDAWLAEAKAIDVGAIEAPPLRATYAIVREALEGSIATRVCRYELWTVSQFVNGWQVQDGYLVTIQPVGTDGARRDAIARWSALPRYIDTEIANLREGLTLGYSAPKGNVRIVIDQMKTLTDGPLADSPFDSPSVRDKSPAFVKEYDAVVRGQIVPAFKRYRDFLETEYLPAARDAVAVSANPNGAACYDASVRSFSSLPIAAKDVHQTGLDQIAQIDAETKAIAERSFQTGDVRGLLERVRTGKMYLFKSREDLIGYSQAALARAKTAIPNWFGLLPKADVVIEPYPKFREKNGPNEYNPPAEDGSRPAVFFINAYKAETKSRAEAEATAFHETIPGHHLQGAIALERKDIHPIGRYLGNAGYHEGWALYAERLADEMQLYSSDLDRLGMLSSQALRAARLVVDSGLHTMNWTRQQAIDYMLAHTAEPRDDVESEVDRYIIYPGQATAYMLGKIAISDAREKAKQVMGARFDIKAFHDRVLEDGAVPVAFLKDKIQQWAAK
ncbi:MAG TPA: DUF885 domain-containing protein [Vicinamibacterales bacterium]|nr:DUF885 domain-containing protein [Vicinamibacterales bacterium]